MNLVERLRYQTQEFHQLHNDAADHIESLERYLNTRHNGTDGLLLLYSVAQMLPACELFAAVTGGIQDFQYQQQRIESLEQLAKEMEQIITRYRNETPIGHQPHMICHVADKALSRYREVCGGEK